MAPKPIRIAITGGGLAGATLMHALLRHPNLDVHIFESAPAFREAGASVGIARNALSALELIGATPCLDRAGAVPQTGNRFMLAQGPDAGNAGVLIGEIEASDQKHLVSSVHRAAFLRELLAGVPPERMHASKKLEKVDVSAGGFVGLHFSDGTTHDCDVLIGADGIHSVVRGVILGDDAAVQPRNTGWWNVMTLKPYSEVQAILGNHLVDLKDPRQYGWTGDGSYLMHGVLKHGDDYLVSLIACVMDEKAIGSDQWQTTVSAEEIRKHFQDWPAALRKAVEELLADQPEQPARYLWEHPAAHTYVSGPLCVMGDAAHATTPWQGAGAGMAIEDALILSALLGRANTVAEAVVALQAYDHVRRPRTRKIVESSRETGLIRTGRLKEVGLSLERNRQNLLSRWDFIIDHDNVKHCEEALGVMDKFLRSSRGEKICSSTTE